MIKQKLSTHRELIKHPQVEFYVWRINILEARKATKILSKYDRLETFRKKHHKGPPTCPNFKSPIIAWGKFNYKKVYSVLYCNKKIIEQNIFEFLSYSRILFLKYFMLSHARTIQEDFASGSILYYDWAFLAIKVLPWTNSNFSTNFRNGLL